MKYANLRLGQEFKRCNKPLLFVLRQWEFVSALRAFSHSALYRRWTARTSECSAIRYVESESAFRTIHDMFRLRAHFGSLSVSQPFSHILKTFLETLKQLDAKIIKTINLISVRVVKSMIKKSMTFVTLGRISLGRIC